MLNAKKMFFVFYLFKRIYDYVKYIMEYDYICIAINPKHRVTYDFLLFKEIGEQKSYESANDAPAIAMYLDVPSVEQECIDNQKEGVFKMFFAHKTNPAELTGECLFLPEDLKYFFAKKSNLFQTASPQEIEYIKSCYPDFDLLFQDIT